MAIMLEKVSYDVHPTGMFDAELQSIEQRPSKNPEWADQLMFTFGTVGNEGTRKVFYFAAKTLSVASKVGKLATTMMGVPFSELPSEFDVEELVGKKVQLVVEHVQKNGRTYANVTSVLPLRQN